uniref:Uncharacterized protein n=1 Tax=Picea sitchensis TaxID=3332 RepID=A9NMB0_PICSI|nr:unknown [Picea sitchensis]
MCYQGDCKVRQPVLFFLGYTLYIHICSKFWVQHHLFLH